MEFNTGTIRSPGNIQNLEGRHEIAIDKQHCAKIIFCDLGFILCFFLIGGHVWFTGFFGVNIISCDIQNTAEFLSCAEYIVRDEVTSVV